VEEKDFKALIRLLDDDDPEISDHVESRLLALGGKGISRLEEAWADVKDENIQNRLEDIIHLIQSRETAARLQAWQESEEEDLLQGWFLLSRYLYPNLEFAPLNNRINRLVNRIWLELRRDMTVAEKLMVINRMLFSKENFRPSGKNVLFAGNYLLNVLLDKRKGGPYSLGLLYKIICDKLEVPLEGIVIPNYFLLRYKDSYNEFYIDVFQKGAFFVKEDVAGFLKSLKLEDNPEYYEARSHFTILLEVMKGLMAVYNARKEMEKLESLQRLLDKL
jgi:regulator of sirC expression with transglutaminase-like and TPR domain